LGQPGRFNSSASYAETQTPARRPAEPGRVQPAGCGKTAHPQISQMTQMTQIKLLSDAHAPIHLVIVGMEPDNILPFHLERHLELLGLNAPAVAIS
jgi:hypothetical protein